MMLGLLADQDSGCKKKEEEMSASPPLSFWILAYGTVNGRIPSVGNIPVGPVAVDGCERNM